MTAAEAKLLHTVERRRFIDELRHNATRQGSFDCAMWHLDHAIPGTDIMLQPSDRGKGAEAIYRAIEDRPLWQTLWGQTVRRLPPTGKRVLYALMCDWRTASAAKVAGVSRPTVDHWKIFFKIHFTQCFRAWKRDFGEF